MVIYHGILNLEKVGTAVNYCGIFYNISPLRLYYKTFYSHNLWIFCNKLVFVPGKPFLSSLMFVGKAIGLP